MQFATNDRCLLVITRHIPDPEDRFHRLLLLRLLLPDKDWALSECRKFFSYVYLKGGRGQCFGCY